MYRFTNKFKTVETTQTWFGLVTMQLYAYAHEGFWDW